jgi:hypothetical protein
MVIKHYAHFMACVASDICHEPSNLEIAWPTDVGDQADTSGCPA